MVVYIYTWLVVSTPLKNISQIGSSSQLLGKHIYRYLSRYTTSKIPFKLDGHFTGDYDDDLGAHQGTDFARTDTNHQSIINSVSIQLFRIIKPDCRHQNHASNQSHHSLVILVISASLSSSSLIHIDSSSTDVPCGIPNAKPSSPHGAAVPDSGWQHEAKDPLLIHSRSISLLYALHADIIKSNIIKLYNNI